jgi:hypothetical protein
MLSNASRFGKKIMPDKWVVFGGWAFGPDLLKPVFGDAAVYVDINELMPAMVEKGVLRADWIDIAREKVESALAGGECGLAGWSTGAIIACGISQIVRAKRLALFSVTPSFCRREGFKFGQRPQVVEAMRRELFTEGNSVVKDFAGRCGFPQNYPLTISQEPQALISGLHFLEQVDLRSGIKRFGAKANVFHGDRDCIIPQAAGKLFAGMIGADFSLMPGGHAFFIGCQALLAKMIFD